MVRSVRAAAAVYLAFNGITASLYAETAQDVADGIVYARGGAARIQNIQTERMTGRVLVGERQGTFTREVMRPDKARMEVALDGETTITTYNGTTGWKREGISSSARNQKLSVSESKRMAEDADIDGPFIAFVTKGTQVDLLDKEMLGPSVVWKLKVTSRTGENDIYYVESTGHYILLRENTRVEKGKTLVFDNIYKNFRRVEGVLFPFTIVSTAQDGRSTMTLQFDNIQLNDPINASDFEQPAAAPPK